MKNIWSDIWHWFNFPVWLSCTALYLPSPALHFGSLGGLHTPSTPYFYGFVKLLLSFTHMRSCTRCNCRPSSIFQEQHAVKADCFSDVDLVCHIVCNKCPAPEHIMSNKCPAPEPFLIWFLECTHLKFGNTCDLHLTNACFVLNVDIFMCLWHWSVVWG